MLITADSPTSFGVAFEAVRQLEPLLTKCNRTERPTQGFSRHIPVLVFVNCHPGPRGLAHIPHDPAPQGEPGRTRHLSFGGLQMFLKRGDASLQRNGQKLSGTTRTPSRDANHPCVRRRPAGTSAPAPLNVSAVSLEPIPTTEADRRRPRRSRGPRLPLH